MWGVLRSGGRRFFASGQFIRGIVTRYMDPTISALPDVMQKVLRHPGNARSLPPKKPGCASRVLTLLFGALLNSYSRNA